uniref:Lamin B n=1 Tax=Halisarca dujardinii TaxID=2583056 RepID=A0AAU8KYU2_HALDU
MEQSAEGNPERLSLSPLTRIQEKEHFQSLNERLEDYIDKVKSLKGRNAGLEAEIAALRDDIKRATQNVKDLYEPKLAAIRALIDKTAREKARQQLLGQGLDSDNRRLEDDIAALEKKEEDLQNRLDSTTQKTTTTEGKYRNAVKDKLDLTGRLKEGEKELDDLRKQYDRLLKRVEDATVDRVDHNNKIMSLTEELTFNKKKNALELDTLRDADSRVAMEKSQITTDMTDQVDGQQDDRIQELKDRSKLECDQLKQELEMVYGDQIEKLQTQNARDAENIGSLSLSVRDLNEKDALSDRELAKLKDQAEQLKHQLRHQAEDLDKIKEDRKDEVRRLVDQQQDLRDRQDGKMKEFKHLFDLKIKLDKETERYRKLLEGEENRLNIVPSPGTKRRKPPPVDTQDSPCSPPKRPKHHIEKQTVNQANVSSTALDYIQITDVDLSGAYIKLKNTSDQAETLSSFKLVHTVLDSGTEDVFVFHQRSRLKGGVMVSVWGYKAGVDHNPPSDVICKHIPFWGVGKDTETQLFNNKGEVMATYVQHKQHTSSIHYTSDDPTGDGMETDGPATSEDEGVATTTTEPQLTKDTGEDSDDEEKEEEELPQGELFHEEDQAPEQGDENRGQNRSCTIA